ncbi:MAG: hypothetical protein N4A33_00010 [Bacteriovoracaceae bacterium]|jgi:hypothetical protein|nr:hypothetical protein [Bacteriovoracaceae bacterium]
MVDKKSFTEDINAYVEIAKNGYLPLFFNEWINQGDYTSTKITYKKANSHIKDIFKKLSKHRTFEKKKTAILGMPEDERKLFLSSFAKVVEYNKLKENILLQ